ncbi:MAG: alpha/beta fold hydrolase [Betaproteobacteria bacterium]
MNRLSESRNVHLTAVEACDIALASVDGFPLAARLWSVPEATDTKDVALINAGAGIASKYYDRFAAFLAERGIPTLVYDYRGIGRSRPDSLKGFQASVEEWGSKDCAAAICWLRNRFPGARLIVIGHSIGGFVTGFVTNGALIDRLLLVSAHTGYWRDYSAIARPLMFLAWHVLMPAITAVVGYFPGKRLRILEDLPKGVAFEWASRLYPDFWWRLKRPDGSPDGERIQGLLSRFAAIHANTLAVRFTDDPFATDEATVRILGLFPNASVERLVVEPTEGDGRPIGHFGFFDSRFRRNLWPRVLERLLTVNSRLG